MRGTARRMSTRERMRLAAAERIGHENAYFMLVYYPILKVLVPVALAGLGGYWLWQNVDHAHVVTSVAVLGIVLLVAYAAYVITRGGLKARMRRRIGQGGSHPEWHFVGLAGALMLIGAYLLAGL